MKATIHFESSVSRGRVMLHAWDPGGDIRDPDVEGKSSDGRMFTFQLEMETADPRDIQFKFFFPGQDGDTWERDAYTRRIPTNIDDAEIWCFDYSRRCTTRNPYAGTVPEQIIVHAISHKWFAGGFVYAWQPPDPKGPSERFELRPNESDPDHWSCIIQVRPWMQAGFNFKLAKHWDNDDFEPDKATRVWRPGDGAEIWVKSRHPAVMQARPVLQAARVELTYSLRAPCPELVVRDDVDDCTLYPAAGQERSVDDDFARRVWEFKVFPEADYRVLAEYERGGDVALSLPFRVNQGDAPSNAWAMVGYYRWLKKSPARDATAKLVVYPNPQSAFGDQLMFAWRPGDAPRTRQDVPLPGCQTAVANRRADGTWEAELKVFSEIPHWVDLLSSPERLRECRQDGEILSRRSFQVPPADNLEISTADGLTGCASGKVPPKYNDMPLEDREKWMKRAFSEPIVSANVFNRSEMPLGATVGEGEILFALFAPHAVCAKVLLLQLDSDEGSARKCKSFDMNVTDDLRYWWCIVPQADLPDPKDVRYRFQLNGDQEVLDPASRQVTQAQYLFAAPGEGRKAAWSVAVDRKGLLDKVEAAGWKPPEWSDLLVYEMHALRFTRRNKKGMEPLHAFAQICEELNPGKYLAQLGVTALELLPIHEFPKEISWGYNPSLHFAIESSYGGPSDFASLVRRAHAQKKAVMLDIVLNHVVESPLQEIAPDVFVDGETHWGDMLNYDHPVAREHFRQAVVSLWDTYRLDGFRLNATLAIVKGHQDGNIVRRKGSGGGWEFLGMLRGALRGAANACKRPWPYIVAENDPNDWDICGNGQSGVVDGQWDFGLQYSLGEAACNREDKTGIIKEVLNLDRPLYQTVRYAESHDAVSNQAGWKQRMVRREASGLGMRMAKATGAVALLAKGIPMLFMGEEAGEVRPFNFEMKKLDDTEAYCDLDGYVDPTKQNSNVLRWFRDLMGLRNKAENGFKKGDDCPVSERGDKTLAFTRANERFFVIATFGTSDTTVRLCDLGLPGGGEYKEIFNSTWSLYKVPNELEVENGRYYVALTRQNNVNLPRIGAIVLERR